MEPGRKPRRGTVISRNPAAVKEGRGFTLLEVLVVLVLMGIVAGIAIPRFKNLFEVELKSSMRRLAGTIKFCFNDAIIKQATIRLNFDISSGTYTYSMLVTDPDSRIGEFVDMPSPFTETEQLPQGVYFKDILTPRSIQKMEDGETYIMFYPTGYAEKAVIHLADAHGRVYTMLVRPLTGGVKIFEGYVDFAEFQQVETPFGTSGGPFGQ
jgi:general secretion pathway protein H